MGLRRMARRRRRRRRRRVVLAGGMVAFGVHKMTESQAKQIEQHTGIPPEELEDEDIEAAMAELNIPKQELTEEDKAAGAGPDADE